MNDTAVLQGVLTLIGLVITGLFGRYSARASAVATERSAALTAEVALDANETEAAKAVVAGAIALSAGIRAELDAVRSDLQAERQAAREQRDRMLARIRTLEEQHDTDAARIDTLERHNARLQRELDAVKRTARRPPGARTRETDA